MAEPTFYLFDGFNLLHAGGFEDSRELTDKLASFVTWLERDGHQFHLLQLPETSHMAAGHAAVPLGDRYEATQKSLRDTGHQVDDHEEYWGSPRSFVRDPGGNLVELMVFAPAPQL